MIRLLPSFSAAVSQKITSCLEKGQKKRPDVIESKIELALMTPFVCSVSSKLTVKASQHYLNPVQAVTCIPGQETVMGSSVEDDRLLESCSSSSSLGTYSQISNVQGESMNSPAELVTVSTARSLSSDIAFTLDTVADVLTVVEPGNNIASSTVVEPAINLQQRHRPPKRQEQHDSKGDDSWLPEQRAGQIVTLRQEDEVRNHPKDGLPEPAVLNLQDEIIPSLPIILQRGCAVMHIFKSKERLLRIWTPRLHLSFEFATDEISTITSKRELLHLEIQRLDATLCPAVEEEHVVDCHNLSSVETTLEDILF